MDDRMSLTMEPPVRQPSARKRLENLFGSDWQVGYLFVLPMVLIMGLLIFWPFVSAIFISTTSLNFLTGETVNVGLRNYERLWTSSDFLQAMGNTITFTFWSLSLKFVIGMTVALILNSRLPFRSLLSGIMLLPWIVQEIVTALAWKSIYDPLFGGLNPILQGVGVIDRPLGWLSDPNMAMGSIISV
ncbi:MAG: sugar ABC transporter permease, partial [Phyllobacteriaceae bacterium]|nr:sugar ABC transporter permease [Phyllobacteriaceae bacterium]